MFHFRTILLMLAFVLSPASTAASALVSVRLHLPSGFDSTVTVAVDTVTVFERVNATCTSPGQETVAHHLGATALTAFHRALERFQFPPNPCGARYELKYFPAYSALYLKAVNCFRENCHVLGWVYAVNGQQPPVGMDQWSVSQGDTVSVDFLPLPTNVLEEIETARPFSVAVGPNPFDEFTEIRLTLPADGELSIAVYNTAGQLVCVLMDHRDCIRGTQRATWDGTDLRRMPVPAGTYFVRITHHGSGHVRILKVHAR